MIFDMKSPRVLLVNPWIVDFAAYDFWLRPLGLLWLGAFLKRAGYEVELLDCLDRTHGSLKGHDLKARADGTGHFLKTEIEKPEPLKFVPRIYGRYGITVEAFIRELREREKPDIAMVTCSMTYWYPGAFEAVRLIREVYPDVPVVMGGRYATLCADHAKAISGADAVITGRAGAAIAEYLKEKTGVVINVPGDIKDWPAPAHSLHPDMSSAAIMTSAGCPFKCTYCVSSILNDTYQTRKPESLKNEIRELENHGTKHFAFYDDALMMGWKDVLEPVLDFVIEKKYEINFYTPNAMHARYITETAAKKMKRAGFSHLRIGYESSDEGFQRDTGGKVNDEQFTDAVRNLLAAGFRGDQIGAYIIFGHPEQTEDSIRSAVHRAGELGVEPVLSEYSPIPGSRDFERAARLFNINPASDPLLHNSSVILYQHPNMEREQMESLKAECMSVRKRIRKE